MKCKDCIYAYTWNVAGFPTGFCERDKASLDYVAMMSESCERAVFGDSDPWDADISAKEASKLMRRKVHFGDVTLFDMPDHEPRADKTQALKILEESSEVLEAQKRYEQNPTLGNLADLRDEVADVIQATANFIGGLDAMGVADGVLDFSDDMKLCEMRNVRRGRISKE